MSKRETNVANENQIVVYQPNETVWLASNSVVSDFATTQRQKNSTIAKSAQVELITNCDKPEGLLLKRVSDVKEAA